MGFPPLEDRDIKPEWRVELKEKALELKQIANEQIDRVMQKIEDMQDISDLWVVERVVRDLKESIIHIVAYEFDEMDEEEGVE